MALLVWLLPLVVLPIATSSPGDLIEIESAAIEDVPTGWTVQGRAPAEHMLELTFAVKQSHLEDLQDTLLRVSDPNSPDYGQHLSNDEVQALVAPAVEDVARITAYLDAHGVAAEAATPNKDLLRAKLTVAVAEEMLATEYSVLFHEQSGARVVRALKGYSLPGDVAAAVDFVAPTVHIPGVHRPKQRRSNESSSAAEAAPNSFNTPKKLRQLYSVGSAEGKAPNNKQAVTAFLEQHFSARSLKTFNKLMCKDIACGKGEVKLVGDGTTGRLPGTEAMLDIEYITGVGGNIESEFWGFAGRSPDNHQNEPFLKWLEMVSSTSDAEVPKVFSTSYGEDEGRWSLSAAKRLNVEFQKAGVRGISLLFASGDQGANCKGDKFYPQGPASSPWVTAVGGTTAGSSWPAPGPDAEEGTYLSSGGFSNYWEMPDYQKTAVRGYLEQKGLPKQSERGYNVSGRAFPDISAQAEDFFVVAVLPAPGVSGTSCSSPTVAGIFSLLNDLRLQQGKSTLGFLNPLIYAHASAFNDITKGSSFGCDIPGGWPAKQGWDAVTGVGTPNYERLASAVDNLPSGRAAAALSQMQVTV
mmetsp:Transcript_39603/g.93323  ORF Transcript_39603/g.93323 Transcript_39603/m.93323 type:complete len:582 (-) Transcript_39603:209-1954(-)